MANEGQAEQIELNFEPIRGYPELRWAGKRPFRSTYYYPAQLRERHGEPGDDGWRNKLYWGDNLQVMAHLVREYRGQVKLIYIDPPYDSKADYKMKVRLRGTLLENDRTTFEEKQYTDIWNAQEYLQFLFERLILLRELLAPEGALFLHCDPTRSHHIRSLLDEVFGPENFRGEVIWQRTFAHSDTHGFGAVHDNIFHYSAGEDFLFHRQYKPHDESYIKSHYGQQDADGRKYRLVTLSAAGPGPARNFGGRVIAPPVGRHWAWSQERIDSALASGKIVFAGTGQPNIKQYLDDTEGTAIHSVWNDIPAVNPVGADLTGYPTQKPGKLLERIMRATTNPGDLVFDAFMGSGTTQAVAMKLGRKFLGCDINLGAIHTTVKRLNDVATDLSRPKATELDAEAPVQTFTAFDVYTVNHYDVFRNEVEAKPLLMEALAITSTAYAPWDGTKFDADSNNRMVKVMPINRIATRADLNDIISGVDPRRWDEKAKANPREPVERITLVCMGHEPELGAHLDAELRKLCNAKFDIEVVDVLRHGANLQFKRESQAKVTVAGGKLTIEAFYPMNLLQKLSLEAQAVGDWKELVDSVMIDWNYDGAVFTPAEVDVPEGKVAKVKGVYTVPKDHGEIRVKITDVLSESWEESVGGAA